MEQNDNNKSNIDGTDFTIKIDKNGRITLVGEIEQDGFNHVVYNVRRAKVETSPFEDKRDEHSYTSGLVDTGRIKIGETFQLEDEIPLKEGVGELALYETGKKEHYYICSLEKKESSSISVKSLLDGVKKIKEKERLNVWSDLIEKIEYENFFLESMNSGFLAKIPLNTKKFNYNDDSFSLVSIVDDDRFVNNFKVFSEQIISKRKKEIEGEGFDQPYVYEPATFIPIPNILKAAFLKAVELRAKEGEEGRYKELLDNIAKIIKEFKGSTDLSLPDILYDFDIDEEVQPLKNKLTVSLGDCFEDTMVELLETIGKHDESILTDNGIDIGTVSSQRDTNKKQRKEDGILPIEGEKQVLDFALTVPFRTSQMNLRHMAPVDNTSCNGLILYNMIHFNQEVETEVRRFSYCTNIVTKFEELFSTKKSKELLDYLDKESSLKTTSFFNDKEKEILGNLLKDEVFRQEIINVKRIYALNKPFNRYIERTVEATKRKYTSFKGEDTSEATKLAYEALVCQDLAQSLMGQDFNFMKVHSLVKQRNTDYVEYFLAPHPQEGQEKDDKLKILIDTYAILKDESKTENDKKTAFEKLKNAISEELKKAKEEEKAKRLVSVYAVGSEKTEEDIYFKDNIGTKYYLYKVTDGGKVEHINTDDLKYDASVCMHYSKQDGTIKIDFKNGLSLNKNKEEEKKEDNYSFYISTSNDISTIKKSNGKVTGATELKFGRMGGIIPGCTIDNEYIEKAIVAEEERKRQEEIVKPTQQKEEESRSKISKSLSAFSGINQKEADNSPLPFKTQGATKDLQR